MSDGRAAAADYLAEVANSILLAGTAQAAWAVARHGLTFAEGRRDWAWAVLRGHDLDRLDAEDPEYPGIVVDTPERREIAQFSPAFERNQGLTQGSRPILWWAQWNIFESRRAALETAGPASLRCRISSGPARIAMRCRSWSAAPTPPSSGVSWPAPPYHVAACSRLRAALGDLALAERDLVRLTELAERAGNPPMVVGVRELALFEVVYCRGTGLELAASAADAVSRATRRLSGAPRRTPSRRFCSPSPDATRMPCAPWPARCPPSSARVVASSATPL